jgi:hypothetical protein
MASFCHGTSKSISHKVFGNKLLNFHFSFRGMPVCTMLFCLNWKFILFLSKLKLFFTRFVPKFDQTFDKLYTDFFPHCFHFFLSYLLWIKSTLLLCVFTKWMYQQRGCHRCAFWLHSKQHHNRSSAIKRYNSCKKNWALSISQK